MALRAVVFDYGMVLTSLPDQEAHAAMVRITGKTVKEFEELYWADRLDYDRGILSGIAFWEKMSKDGDLNLTREQVEELNRLDAQMWTTQNPEMLAWQKHLKERGIKTAILSNMGDSVLESIERQFAWIHGFDVLVWSYKLGMAKPDPEIYQHTLERLGVEPEEALFLDDKEINVEGARALGMQSLVFSNVADLREQMRAAGMDRELPLP